MSNRCYTTIVLCGSNAAIAKAEDSLKAIYRDSWDDAVERGSIRVPRGRRPEYTYRVYPPAYVYYLSYPWHPPGAELDKLAAEHPGVVMAVAYDEDGVGLRGQVFCVDGKRVARHEGCYGPDGHELYDETAPLPDFNSTLDFYIFTAAWNGKKAAFAEAER